MASNRQTAIDLAQHYFAALASACGLPWSGDNDGEVELMILAIIAAAREEA